MQIGNVAELVLFILPGYLATQLRDFLIRTRKPDNFERFAWSLFLSLVAYLPTTQVMKWAYGGGWRQRTNVSLDNLLFIIVLFGFAMATGYVAARLNTSRRLQGVLRRWHVDTSEHPNVWNEIWQCERGAPWVIVRLKDGGECFGALRRYSVDPNDSYRELWLFPVAESADPDQEPKTVPGLSVYIPGDQIVSVSAYRPDDQPRT